MSGRTLLKKGSCLAGGFLVVSLGSIAPPSAVAKGSQPQDQSSSGAQPQASSDSSVSIAEAARRSREAAKNATKPSKVISDDDLDKSNIKPGSQGLTVDAPAKLETEPPSAGAVAVAETTHSVNYPATAPAAGDDPAITKVKGELAEAETDADYAKRELALQQDTFYSNADYGHDTAGKAKLDTLKQEIEAKQQNIERLKAKLAAMEAAHPAPAAPDKTNEQSSQPPAASITPPAQR